MTRALVSSELRNSGKKHPKTCTVCQELEEELANLERIHAEKAQTRVENWRAAGVGEDRQLRTAENAAMLRMEIMRAELKRHKRIDHGMA